MTTIKKLLFALPEYLLILAVLFYWYSTALIVNYVAIVLLAILVFQIISKHRILGLIIPSLLILICFYMLLALASELREFPSFNTDAKILLFVGLIFFLGTIAISGIMIYKYSTQVNQKKLTTRN